MNQPVPAATPQPATITRPTSVTASATLFGIAGLLMLVQTLFVGTYRSWMLSLVNRQLDLMNIPDSARGDVSSSITSSLVQTGISLALGGAFWILLAVLIYRGTNWARIVAMIFGMVGVILGPLALLYTLALAPPPAAYSLTSIPGLMAIIVGMVLVWRRPAKEWCAPHRATHHASDRRPA